MAFVYKISNLLNNKVYIGMTTTDVQTRWREHLKAYKNKNLRMYGFKLYRAMRSLGAQNFYLEVLEECDRSKAPQREQYYIQQYKSTTNGYNESLGGFGKKLISEKQVEAFKILYDQGWLLMDIAEVFHVNVSTIGKKLHKHFSVDTLQNSHIACSKKIIATNSNEIHEFLGLRNAAEFIIAKQLSKAKKLTTIQSKIHKAIKNANHSAYGYKWKHE